MTTEPGVRGPRPEERWTAMPPSGWEPISELCRKIFESLPAIVERIDEAICQEIPEFARPASPVSQREMRWSVTRNVASFLHGVAERRSPTRDEVSFRRVVGEKTAQTGIALQPLITSFHIAYRELWRLLVEQAQIAGGSAPTLILEGGSTIWEWMVSTSNAVAEGHQKETARREAAEARTVAHFIEILIEDSDSDECSTLAKELAFDPYGPFRMIAMSGNGIAEKSRMVIDELQTKGGKAAVAIKSRHAILITQHVDIGTIDSVIASCSDESRVGIGLEGVGLAAAAESLEEAEASLTLSAVSGRVAAFERDWLLALSLVHRASLDRMLSPGIELSIKKPRLAEAVEAFAAARLSVAETARRLYISQNSLRYRLTRWQEITGWDPWSLDGLTRSMVAMNLAKLKNQPSSSG